MNKRSCQKCLYTDSCPGSYPCRYYLSVEEDDDSELIERGRLDFRQEWQAYLEDAEASYFS